jgi:TolB-like protein
MTPLRQGSSGQGAPNQAVFLSYASQDAAAVERIAEALRAAGVEVWFDRNELVGGDAWDRKIRQQIRECALFVPVISAATQVRGEGYFRLEWKLAVDRSHLMAPDQPFLLPVVIDDTPDAAARVADEFRAVQWTRLPAGETPVKFCTRLKALLGGSAVLQPALGTEERGLKHRATPKPSRPWLVPTALGLAAVIAVAALLIFRPKSEPAAQVASHQPTAEKSAPLTEAQQLVAKARAIWEAGDELNRETYVLAEELLLKAEKLDPTEASAWALHAIISRWFRGFGFDMSPQRQEALRMQAERAAKLAPGTLDADLATIAMRSTQAATAAQEALVELARRHPGNARVATALGMPMSGMAQDQTILDALQHSHAADPDNVRVKAAILNAMYQLGRIEEAEELVARWLPSRPNGRILLFDVHFKMWWRGDLVGAATAIERWPAWLFLEDRGVQSAGLLWHWKRDGERLLRTANGFLRDYVRVSMFTGPRAVLRAWALELLARPEQARAEWQNAVRVADRELEEFPGEAKARYWKAWALTRLDQKAEAESLLRLLEEDPAALQSLNLATGGLVGLQIQLGQFDRALEALDANDRRAGPIPRRITKAQLALSPVFDPLRNDPRFQALMAAAPGPEEKKETKPTTATPAAPAVSEKSLVVLPLENLSPDPANAFFTDGMHAQIIATLQRTTDLHVFGRDTALAFKRGSTTVAEFAQRLGAANVLTGSVHRAGTKARIVLELRRASDDALLWQSPETPRDLSDTWAVQSEVAEQVARALKARESVGSNTHARYLTKNSQAFDLFVKGDQLFFAGEFARAIPLYTESYALDSGYVAPAYMLAHAHCNLLFESVDPAARLRDAAEARRWIEVVTRLDPTGFGAIAESHYASNVDEDNLRALEQAERGMRAIPNDTAAPTFHAVALEGLGRMAEALESYHRATQIDPLLVFSLSNEARVLTLLRREREALAMLARMADVVGTDQSPDSIAHRRIAQQFFRLRGNLPPAIESISSPRERARWLLRARRFAEAERAATEAAIQTGIIDVVRFDALVLRHDALLRLNRRADAETAARELLELARKLQATTEVGPPRKAGWLAVAEARAGHDDAAISAARRFVEDAASGRQQAIRWQREIAFAELYAYLNRPRECCELLAKLLRVPSGLTVPMLKVDPMWDNVRDGPAFKALLADPKNSAPL